MIDDLPGAEDPELLRQKLALETASIGWRELEPHYARGVVVQVTESLDLVEVGFELIQDNKSQVQKWMSSSELGPVNPEEADRWHHSEASVWALVVAPWVLVQKKKPQ
ncbi:hypothetical protein SAMN05660443_2291 [Marinospirillum celere]|uniref:DUF2288 domain-containing protein n=1 Tax=Marinospirillum celere TaxID=1122252 RepID=A0A1I1IGI2_9GAMM|nr:DUF2288 domain-containing protein [Marinospirillum celere]SFC32863.1 hypothetical protein SAMN05660443_2291 [Marinospirillum celere]